RARASPRPSLRSRVRHEPPPGPARCGRRLVADPESGVVPSNPRDPLLRLRAAPQVLVGALVQVFRVELADSTGLELRGHRAQVRGLLGELGVITPSALELGGELSEHGAGAVEISPGP